MKKLLSAFIVLVSVNAFATKARLQALSNSFHLVDPQTIYGNPLDLMSMKNFISIESGSTAATGTSDNAEGSISYGLNDHSQFAVSLGHKDDAVMGVRSLINTQLGSTYLVPQNPIHLFYGYKTDNAVYAAGVSYSNFNDKKNDAKETSSLVSLGAQWGEFQIYALTTLANTVETGTTKFEGNGYVTVGARYSLDTVTLGLDAFSAKAKSTTVATQVENASADYQALVLGLVDVRSKDGSDFFYGAQIVASKLKNRLTSNDMSRTSLPVWFGIEAKANEWLTLRGSILQTLIVSQTKDDQGFTAGDGYSTGATGAVSDVSGGPNNTVVAMGIGLNFKNVTIDGVLKGLTGPTANQQVDQTNFMSQVGMTYNF
jgi:hypothetical protein